MVGRLRLSLRGEIGVEGWQVDQDSGASAELGYLFARGKPCFGVTDDFRYLNNMLWGICGEGRRIARDIDGLLSLLEAWRAAGGPVGSAAPGPVQPGSGLPRAALEPGDETRA
ncbi:MAG: hypothetical protein ACPL8I_09365 [Chloroflexaceae bacterium]